ncbi:hypothetical protein Tco_0889737 [Tanacetum coccineum]
MAQPQCPADVHQDELCLPNKRYALMDANKKVDLENPLTIFHLPQATDNNHDGFVPAPSFPDMVPFYISNLGFTLELRAVSNFKTNGLLQPWQTLCKIFTKLIVSHYMTVFPEISRRACDRYHNLENDVIIKSIFNSGKNKNIVGMRILDWMITEEIKLTENYRLYAEVLGIDVPTTHAQRRSTVIRLCILPRRSTRLTPPTPIPTAAEAEEIVLQDTLQVSLAEKKSHDEDEARENMEQVKQHLMAEEIEKLVEGSENVAENVTDMFDENVEVSSSPPRNDDSQSVPGTRLEPKSDKESPEMEITVVVTSVNVIDEEEDTTVGA